MKRFTKLAAATIVAAAGLTLVASNAMAAVVCNQEGECWHTSRHYDYHPEFGVSIHPNNWRWGHDDHYRWHEHHGRGYWHNGVWVTF